MEDKFFNSFVGFLATFLGLTSEAVYDWIFEMLLRHLSKCDSIAEYISHVLAPFRETVWNTPTCTYSSKWAGHADEALAEAIKTLGGTPAMIRLQYYTREEDIDKLVISWLQPYFPAELKEKIYCGPDGKRALRFREYDGKVTITCPPEVRDWLESIPENLEPILKTWVGPSYSGYSFDDEPCAK